MSSTFKAVLTLVKARDVRISEHGYDELAEDGLTVTEILNSIGNARLVEDYPDYPKGPSVLVLQFDREGRSIHTVWGIPKGHDRPAVLVTAYRPDPSRWNATFTKRRK
ncbi:MAG: DUF4258 domain-containing protein [Burkholderiales bacterium]|nr:DUF4258 domain-containing protein [Burkholderiales bacterium]